MPEPLAEGDTVREALERLSRVVIQETEGHRFGTPSYDMTLDHLHDEAVAARAALDAPERDSGCYGGSVRCPHNPVGWCAMCKSEPF